MNLKYFGKSPLSLKSNNLQGAYYRNAAVVLTDWMLSRRNQRENVSWECEDEAEAAWVELVAFATAWN